MERDRINPLAPEIKKPHLHSSEAEADHPDTDSINVNDADQFDTVEDTDTSSPPFDSTESPEARLNNSLFHFHYLPPSRDPLQFPPHRIKSAGAITYQRVHEAKPLLQRHDQMALKGFVLANRWRRNGILATRPPQRYKITKATTTSLKVPQQTMSNQSKILSMHLDQPSYPSMPPPRVELPIWL